MGKGQRAWSMGQGGKSREQSTTGKWHVAFGKEQGAKSRERGAERRAEDYGQLTTDC
jgi:hypothetical protein